MKIIPHSKPWLKEEDFTALKEIFCSGMVGQGDKTKIFEQVLSQWVGIENGGVAVGSGAAALVLALSALGVSAGDEVVFPTYVCPSVLEAVLSVEATPILCDVGANWIVTPENMANCINRNTKALIIPHMYGIFVDISSFRQFNIPIIEDCAQAIHYKGKRNIYGDIAMFSFHPTKCLTTGEGGMAISADPGLASLMRSIRDGDVYVNQGRLFSPMSDISASLGLSQLSRYEEALDRRMVIADKYISNLQKVIPDSIQHSAFENSMYFRFPILINGGLDFFQNAFALKKIHIRKGVDKLLHRFLKISDDNYKESVRLFDITLSLPIYPALTDEELSYCINSAVEIFSESIR